MVRHRRKRRAVDPICHRDVGEHIVVEHLVDKRHVLVVAERHLEDIVEQGDDGAGAEREIDGAEVGEGERMQKGVVDGGGDIKDRDGVGEGDVEDAAVEKEAGCAVFIIYTKLPFTRILRVHLEIQIQCSFLKRNELQIKL